MSEREAWLFLAEKWKSPKMDFYGCFYITLGVRCYGLCHSIRNISGLENKTAWEMVAKISQEEENLPVDVEGYLWPHDLEGSISRVKFCERMAAECETY